MARLNRERGELTATLVVFGASRAGKSSVLRCVHDRVEPSRLGEQWPLGTPPSGVPLLDWLPLELGRVGGWRTRVNLYGIPAERHADATRRLVLADADAVLFVVDSQAARLGENLDALRALQAQLLDRDGDVRDIPLVMLYNKQDLPAEMILTPDVLSEALNFRGAPSFACDALRGVGVLEGLHAAVTRLMRQLAPAAE
ncbi:MAG: GTPase domain-containing protein [Gemmatimonadota bacterium]